MKSIFLFLGVSFLITSCADINKSKQLAGIDQITQSTDSLTSLMEANRSDSSQIWADNAQGIELRFKQYYFADSIDKVLANKVNDLKQTRKKMGHLSGDHLNILQGCKELKESLRLLRHDIENADGDRKKYTEYISHERSKLNTLSIMGTDYLAARTQSFETYERLYPELFAFSMELFHAFERTKKSGK